jgi:Flp pilus assembly protein TadG
MNRLRIRLRAFYQRTGRDSGQISVFAVVMMLAFLAAAGLVLDGGLALSVKVQALDQAQAAARIGAQQLDLTTYRTTGVARLDPARADAAARDWLTRAGLDGQVTATIATVTVTVRRSSDTQLLRIVGVDTLAVSATASATALQGVTGPNT